LEKVREIGIRKVLGAAVSDILKILVSNTLGQFALATLFGMPLAWYLGQQYLEKFSEQVPLSWWHYLFPVIILMSIIVMSIFSILYRAWRNNPVEALKHE
jgi:putative ABC transport system permease protein